MKTKCLIAYSICQVFLCDQPIDAFNRFSSRKRFIAFRIEMFIVNLYENMVVAGVSCVTAPVGPISIQRKNYSTSFVCKVLYFAASSSHCDGRLSYH